MSNYLRIEKNDLTNGPGIRVTIFFSGCSHKCEGCQNPESWDFNNGEIFTNEVEEKIFNYLDHPYIDGVSLSGGDPLNTYNRSVVLDLVKNIRNRFPEKSIWVWTGYLFEELMENNICREILSYIDVLVDGKFDKDIRKKDFLKKSWKKDLAYRGSSNQRVIDVKLSLKNNKAINLVV